MPIPEPTIDELVDRWKSASPTPPKTGSVKDLLTKEYEAYRVPVGLMEPDGFEYDEEIRNDLIDSLYTLTNPLILEKLLKGRATDENAEEHAEEAEFYWRELFDGTVEELPYRVMSAQHALGQRVSILLEREGSLITGFKVYGVAGNDLNERLTAIIGFPVRRPQDPEEGPFMRPGDRSDSAFVQYLEAAARHGHI
ncbi:hypothetical protein [Glutamicibacter sp. 2E12]|uniref:hypothetical protein n=1 Tax=Glutamicibacter sp. 2E12 TaxID=3416181 RepID=UPI003CEBA849